MVDIPTNEPGTLVAGDRWQWRREDLSDNYPAPTWTLTYYFHKSDATFNIVAAADGEHFAVDVAPDVTADVPPGDYIWDAYAETTGDRQRVDQGQLTVQPNLSSTEPIDRRSHAHKVLDAIEAVLEGRASQDQESYAINGRSLSRTPLEDLLVFRDRYKAEVDRLNKEADLAAGLGGSNKISTRFTRI